ncbi:hypothetical protein B0H13DRAFT_2354098 [Mycena leptocephala]|nr:hypothetical protein B0H13DRAFT_2354098 [Mycena leptocephala]
MRNELAEGRPLAKEADVSSDEEGRSAGNGTQTVLHELCNFCDHQTRGIAFDNWCMQVSRASFKEVLNSLFSRTHCSYLRRRSGTGILRTTPTELSRQGVEQPTSVLGAVGACKYSCRFRSTAPKTPPARLGEAADALQPHHPHDTTFKLRGTLYSPVLVNSSLYGIFVFRFATNMEAETSLGGAAVFAHLENSIDGLISLSPTLPRHRWFVLTRRSYRRIAVGV